MDFYRLIDTIDINQIRFTDFYPLTTPGFNSCRCNNFRNKLRPKKKIGTLSKDDDDGSENVGKKMIFQT